MKPLNNWQVDEIAGEAMADILHFEQLIAAAQGEEFHEEDLKSFVVYHYIGGEDPVHEDSDFFTREEAEARRDQLNAAGVTIKWSGFEGEYTYKLFNMPE